MDEIAKTIENSTRKLLEVINTFRKDAEHKINTQISVDILYTNDKHTEKEIWETILLTKASKTITYLGIMLTKEMEGLSNKKFSTLKKEIEEDTWRLQTSTFHGLVGLILRKLPLHKN